MPRKVLTRHGEVTYSDADLAAVDLASRKQLAVAKRKKRIRVEDGFAYFNMQASSPIPHDMQTLLKSCVNIDEHGKAWAVEASLQDVLKPNGYMDAHHAISRSHTFTIPVKFNLKTGELVLDLPTTIVEKPTRCYHSMCRNGKCVKCGASV